MIKKNDYSRKGRRKIAPPDKIARSSKIPERKTSVGSVQNSSLDVTFSRKERQNHTHVLGGSGLGKSKFLEILLRQDIVSNDCGLCLLDPHGLLYDSILQYIAHAGLPSLAERVILFNPAEDLDYVLGYNPIRQGEPIEPLAENIVDSCLKVWGQDDRNETPGISSWFPNVLKPLIRNNLSFLEAEIMLDTSNNNYREILLQNTSNTGLRWDWESLFLGQKTVRDRNRLVEGTRNRFRRFLSNEIIRNIIGQTDVRLNLSEVVNQGKILLINLNQTNHNIDHEDSKLLGTMIISELFRVAKNRDYNDPKLKPFYLYIDEFSEYVTETVASTLDQTRKYKLFAILAHQHLDQLKISESSKLYGSVMTNCKNKVVFGDLRANDAELMAEELYTGHIDLNTIKDEIYRTRVAYDWQDKETTTEMEGRDKTTNWNNTREEASSKTTKKSEGQNRQRASAERHNPDNYRVNRSDTDTDIRTTGMETSESQKTGDSYGEGGGVTERHSRAVARARDYAPIREVQELASRTFKGKDELMYEKKAQIKNQEVGEAIIRIGKRDPVRCQVKHVRSFPYERNYTKKRIDEFRQKVIENHPQYYLPFLDASERCEQRQIELFGDVIVRYDNDIANEMKYKQHSQEEEPEDADNGLL